MDSLKKGGIFYDSSSEEEPEEAPKQPVSNLEEEKGESADTQPGKDLTTNSQIKAPNSEIQTTEATILEYKNKLAQLERLLREEEEIRSDPDKREEVEKLRD